MDQTAAQQNYDRMAKAIEMTPFMRHLGMEFVEADEGYAKLKMRYQKQNSTFADALHGGAISSLIDTTGAMAAWTTAEIMTPKYFGSTVGINVNYLSGAIGEDIFAEGRVLKRGKEIIYSDVRVVNGAGKLLAQGTVVYRIIERGRVMTAVIPLVEEPEGEELRELYERLAQGMPELGVLNIFKVMAHNPQLLRGWLRMATPLLAGGLTLSPRLREIAILRVAQVCGSEYEFAHHIRIAQQAGLSEEEIASLQNYDESELFSELDRAVVRYTDATANLSPEAPELAREMKRWLSDRELLELSFCVGHWGMLARVLVPLEVPVDEALEATLPEGWREWL